MRVSILLGFVTLTILLASCAPQGKIDKSNSDSANYEVINMSSAEVTEGDFIYRLVTEKEEYRSDESVTIYAELEYIGDKETVTIYHSASPFYFPIVEKTRDYDIGYGMDQPLLNTTLKRGELLREEYKKSGGYSEKDKKEYIDFMKIFWENGYPAGYYVVDGYVEFFVQSSVDGKENKEDFNIKAKIEFEVNEKMSFRRNDIAEQIISLEQVNGIFGKSGITLSDPQNMHPDNVFLSVLNNIKPKVFETDLNQLISIYEYRSSDEVKKGLKDFIEGTASADLVSHERYECDNLLIFYVLERGLEDDRVISALSELMNVRN